MSLYTKIGIIYFTNYLIKITLSQTQENTQKFHTAKKPTPLLEEFSFVAVPWLVSDSVGF